jgi:pyruvate/2-oxoglutarate dehydrogenase complex dihydrolipoamide acyltransferase (E2) component
VAKVTMPQLGETVAEGTIGRWLKRPGERVVKGEALVEIVTDKVNAEVPSPFAGIVTALLVEEGAAVPTGTDIAVIDEAEGVTTPAVTPSVPAPAPVAPAQAATAPAVAPAPPPAAPHPRTAAPAAATPGSVAALPGDPDARMTPAVRRLLREHGLVPAAIVGTGHGGRITRADVLALVAGGGPLAASPAAQAGGSSAAAGPAVAWAPGVDEEVVPLSKLRRAIAAQMQK